MLATSLYVSRPVLSIAGQPNAALSSALLALSVEEMTAGLSSCEARVANYGAGNGDGDYLWFGRDVIDFGTELAVSLGPPGGDREVFRGTVSALEALYPDGAPAQLVVFAEDRLMELRMTRRTRTFEDESVADIASRIAREHGLTPQVDLDGPVRQAVAQVNQSDLAFLRDQARSVGGEVWIEGTTLFASSRQERATGRIELRYGGQLISFRVRADLADQYSEVGVSGWDVGAKDAIDETADDSVLGQELDGGTSGSSILRSVLAPRRERVVRAVPLASDEARSMATALYLHRARRFVVGTGLADGTAGLRVGSAVALSGLGGLFDGGYYVARVRHVYGDEDGFRTEFDVERPGLGQATP